MIRKNTYTSNELPDGVLQELEEVRDVFLQLIGLLTENHSPLAIHAGLSRAHLEMIKMGAGNDVKKVLMQTADYYLKQAEKVEADDNPAK